MTYETQILQGKFVGKPRDFHMRQATKQLRADIQAGRVSVNKFTWHHNERAGRMQLVSARIHRKTSHIGSIGLKKNFPTE